MISDTLLESMPNSDSQLTRGKIIASAFDLFATNGYKGTSMQDVADAVGLKKPNVFYYFETKEALALAVITLLQQKILDHLTSFASEPKLGARELLIRISDSAADDPVRAWSAISSEMVSCHSQLHAAVKGTLHTWHAAVLALIEPDPAMAWAIISVWQGATAVAREADLDPTKPHSAMIVAQLIG